MKTRGKSSKLRTVHGQPSWRLATREVEAFITRAGGHVAPVTFKFGRRKIQPFSIAPWATEKQVQSDRSTPPIIKVLRGDFFCMPFGANSTKFGRERHPVHGELANRDWKIQEHSADRLRARMDCRIRRARVEKIVELKPGHHAVYSRHVIAGASGPMTVGHHAMLKFPDRPAGGIVSTSPFVYGQVFPEPVERPENRGYSILRPGAEFKALDRVPMITGEMADLSRYPARRGFEDLVLIASHLNMPFAWTAVTFPNQRFVWFALRDPRVLRSTIFWISNGGRHYPPWSSRHVNVMGLEEVTANFHYGLAESAGDNPLAKRGIATTVRLDPVRPTVVNYIMAVTEIPAGFDRVVAIERIDGGASIRAASGKSVETHLDLDFLGGQ